MEITSTTNIQNYDLPRSISFFLKMNIVFGNVYALLGIIFFLMGSVFALIFGVNSDLDFSHSFEKDPANTKAMIVAVSGTGSEVNERPVLKYTFKFIANNKEYISDSYSNEPQSLFEKDSVLIEYNSTDPSVSRIKNMIKAPFPAWVFFITLIFPSIGVWLLIYTLYRGKKNISLVRNGYLTTGKVIDKIPTNTRINNRVVYEMVFEYTSTDGILRKASTKTHIPERVQDEEKEKLLFNLDKPDEAILVDALPRAVKKFFINLGN